MILFALLAVWYGLAGGLCHEQGRLLRVGLDAQSVIEAGNIMFAAAALGVVVVAAWRRRFTPRILDLLVAAGLAGLIARDAMRDPIRLLTIEMGPVAGDGTVEVAIGSLSILPNTARILNCGWHGCVGIQPHWLVLTSREGCDGTWWRDFPLVPGIPLRKEMRLGVDADQIGERLAKRLRQSSGATMDAAVLFAEPSAHILRGEMEHVRWRTIAGPKAAAVPIEWIRSHLPEAGAAGDATQGNDHQEMTGDPQR